MENTKKLKMQEIVETIIADMKSGVLPWEKPWVASGLCALNASTGKAYRGINTLYLASVQSLHAFKTSRWVTFRQAMLAGGRIKAGAKGNTVVFYERTAKKEKTEKEDGTTEETLKAYSLLKFYTVFNLDQTEGLEKLYPVATEEKRFEDVDTAEALIARTGAVINHLEQGKSFYSPSADAITLPLKTSFKSNTGYYSTAFHELTHWTGNETRLNRDMKHPFGSPEYAFEELVAELGAAFLMNRVAMPYSTQHAAYVESWIKVLEKDVRNIFRAAALAQNAADLVLGTSFTEKEEAAA